MYENLGGRIVIVTGASSGIGAATARLLHHRGARPVLAARRGERLRKLSNELDDALAVPTDITDPKQITSLVNATLDRYGSIDGLVNNAGASLHAPLEDVELPEFLRVLHLNVVGLGMMQAVIPSMRRQHRGRIVNVSSGTTMLAPPGVGAYAASKAAVNMLTEVARKECAPLGIEVSLVLPSITATEFNGSVHTTGKPAAGGLIAHSPEYVGQFILRALSTGEDRIDIPHGPEDPTTVAAT